MRDGNLFNLLSPKQVHKESFEDKNAKLSIITHITAGLIYEESLLYPMMSLLKPLADLVLRYYAQGDRNDGEYDALEEIKGVNECAGTVERFLCSQA